MIYHSEVRSEPERIIDDYTTRDGSTIIAALRESGWIIVRSDAIRLAQAHARADNDNVARVRHKAA